MIPFQLGIDVAKAKLDCALRLPEGKLRHKVVENSPSGFQALSTWLAKQGAGSVHVCMEATGTYWEAVAEYLAGIEEVTVSVINPAQIKAFGASRMVRTKTDKADAKLIAEFCFERRPEPWQAPAPAEQILRALVLRLEALQAMRTQESNRLEVARPALKDSIARHIEWIDREIAQIIQAIRITLITIRPYTTSSACSTAFPAWASAPLPSCWPSMPRRGASAMHGRRWRLPDSIHGSMNQAAA